MTFEEWLEEHVDRAMANRDQSAVHPNSWGHAYDSGYYNAVQMIFASLPKAVAFAPMDSEPIVSEERS